MLNIDGKNYLTPKELAKRYGYSKKWLQQRRKVGAPPSYIKVGPRRIYYQLDVTDMWFKSYIKNF